MKKYFIFVLFLFLTFACRWDRVYTNRQYRYKVQYPVGWIAINSGYNKVQEDEWKAKIEAQSGKGILENVDVAFYNPDSQPPIYQSIMINSIKYRLNLKNVELPILEHLIKDRLMLLFDEVRIIRSEMAPYKNGKMFHLEFECHYEGQFYTAVYLVLPGKLYATHFISCVTPSASETEFEVVWRNVLRSFTKY